VKVTKIKYRGGYKYQLAEDVRVYIPELEGREPYDDGRYLSLINGILLIRAGYAWDGPSGPTIDTKNSMRGSLVHDALYQLLRVGHLSIIDGDRELADDIMYDIMVEDGMWRIRAWTWFNMVRGLAESAATSKPKEILLAP
jgi:hypothetical protein